MAIRAAEFAAALARCLPAVARPRIAVANSAGPDSTCLLFLLRRLFPPRALLSVHVHHSLQPLSDHMALLAADNARFLGIPHHPEPVPPPFPPVPTSDLERTARDARYHLLFRALSRAGIPLLALGHHADDQLETAILRLARGSSFLGAAGMRPARRWGMGSDAPLAAFGHRGLDTFVLRPLLSFPKDRILATCHAHRLPYVNDPTNVQPHLTPRNAVRHALSCDPPFSRPVSLPPAAPFSPHKIENAVSSLQSIAPDIVDQRQRLRSAVATLAARAESVHRQVTSHLTRHALPSPIGTLLLPSDALLDLTDPLVRSALVLHVLRHVSFHPWGSLRADADRRQSSISRIVRALWNSGPQSPIKKFTAGGGVLWTPITYHPNKPLRLADHLGSAIGPGDRFCWLASRMPPFAKNPQQQGAGSPAKLVIDLTDRLVDAMACGRPTEPLTVLYDCRFLIRVDLTQMPTYVEYALKDKTATVRVLSFTRYHSPKVVLQRACHPDHVLAVPSGAADSPGTPSWISIRWIRPLDAT